MPHIPLFLPAAVPPQVGGTPPDETLQAGRRVGWFYLRPRGSLTPLQQYLVAGRRIGFFYLLPNDGRASAAPPAVAAFPDPLIPVDDSLWF